MSEAVLLALITGTLTLISTVALAYINYLTRRDVQENTAMTRENTQITKETKQVAVDTIVMANDAKVAAEGAKTTAAETTEELKKEIAGIKP